MRIGMCRLVSWRCLEGKSLKDSVGIFTVTLDTKEKKIIKAKYTILLAFRRLSQLLQPTLSTAFKVHDIRFSQIHFMLSFTPGHFPLTEEEGKCW